jgi:polyhydroxyalkanoate synthesis regulator phasin
MAKSTLKSYIEAGAQFTEMPRQQAEAFVKTLVKSGDIRRRDAEQLLQTLLSRGRETSDRIATLVQAEVAKQVGALSERFDGLEGRLETLALSIKVGIGGDDPGTTRTSGAGEAAASTGEQPAATEATRTPAMTAPAKKSSATKSSAKKSSATKSSAKRTSPKKSSARKSSAKKSSPKKSAKKSAPTPSDAVGSSGVRKVSTTRPDTTE